MGTSPPSHTNREAAFCLSYYGGLVLESSPREWSCLPSTFPRGAPQPLSTWLLDQVLEESLGLGLCVCVYTCALGGTARPALALPSYLSRLYYCAGAYQQSRGHVFLLTVRVIALPSPGAQQSSSADPL